LGGHIEEKICLISLKILTNSEGNGIPVNLKKITHGLVQDHDKDLAPSMYHFHLDFKWNQKIKGN